MRSGTSSARAELTLATPLIECHAHVLPDGALARFPDGGDPRYVTAERRVLGRMLEAHDACGVTPRSPSPLALIDWVNALRGQI